MRWPFIHPLDYPAGEARAWTQGYQEGYKDHEDGMCFFPANPYVERSSLPPLTEFDRAERYKYILEMVEFIHQQLSFGEDPVGVLDWWRSRSAVFEHPPLDLLARGLLTRDMVVEDLRLAEQGME